MAILARTTVQSDNYKLVSSISPDRNGESETSHGAILKHEWRFRATCNNLLKVIPDVGAEKWKDRFGDGKVNWRHCHCWLEITDWSLCRDKTTATRGVSTNSGSLVCCLSLLGRLAWRFCRFCTRMSFDRTADGLPQWCHQQRFEWTLKARHQFGMATFCDICTSHACI